MTAVHVRVAGSYRNAKQGWVRVGGVYRKFHRRFLQSNTVTAVGTDGANHGFYDAVIGGGSGIGSISSTAYTDVSGVARTIRGIYETDTLTTLSFWLAGTVANSDSVFGSLFRGSVEYSRAAASYAVVGGDSQWSWAMGGVDELPSAPRQFDLWS